jgi:hypothetical protein
MCVGINPNAPRRNVFQMNEKDREITTERPENLKRFPDRETKKGQGKKRRSEVRLGRPA